MRLRTFLSAVALLGAAVSGAPAAGAQFVGAQRVGAQGAPTPPTLGPSAPAPLGGPTLRSASVAFRRPGAPATEPGAYAAAAARFSRSQKFLIFGSAAFLAGLLIGDEVGTVMAASGAVLALYGLYIYLNQ